MSRLIIIVFILSLLFKPDSSAQSQKFIAKPVQFSTRIYDEFSPVFLNGGIVYSSNQPDNSVISYNDDLNRLFKIFYIRKRGNSWGQPGLLANDITSAFNDGPVTFNPSGKLMYFTRNNSIKSSWKNISDTTNKLGIYSAELIDGIWTNIKAFKYNNINYSLCTPSLSPDGERIYFASDKPGGSGGMDLYYCDRVNDDWSLPVNMGRLVNTNKNESFPFASEFRKLFFSSDGLKGFGLKDLYYTKQVNGDWLSPVHLDSAINSPYDDFGIVVDSTLENGYFSSNRRRTDDIFSFSAAPLDFANCDSIKKNRYCYTFYDEQHRLIDTIPVTYNWDFGDGKIQKGIEAFHCFPGPGHYLVKLNITDDLTGDTLAKQVEYKVDLENINQAIINSPDVGSDDKSIPFEGIVSDLKDARITDFFWDFGDGFKPGGPVVNHVFRKKGEYTVRLGLLKEKDNMDFAGKVCVMKKIKIN